MPEFLKYLGGKLRDTYDKVVGKPLPWSMIDKLESLDERAEQSTTEGAGSSTAPPSSAGRPAPGPDADGSTKS
jgi:hypothetical protein